MILMAGNFPFCPDTARQMRQFLVMPLFRRLPPLEVNCWMLGNLARFEKAWQSRVLWRNKCQAFR